MTHHGAAMAAAYLHTLAPDGCWTFQTFDDSDQKRQHLARVLHCHGRFDEIAPTLADLNNKGAGVFLMVNRGNLAGRNTACVTALRALFIDADNIPFPDTFHRTPDLFVCRDETHWHAYWLLPPSVALEAFREGQLRMAAHYGTDPKINDLPRVMRVPGFMHHKSNPTLVRLEHPHVPTC